MSEDHGVHEPNAARQPRCPQMGGSIQQMHCKEQNAQALFRYSKAAEKPISNQCIRQKSAAESIQGKQTCQFCDHLFGCWRDGVRKSLRR